MGEPDDASSSCFCCELGFSVFHRKHHCRACGRLVCDDCSKHKLEGQRICDTCWNRQCIGPIPSFMEMVQEITLNNSNSIKLSASRSVRSLDVIKLKDGKMRKQHEAITMPEEEEDDDYEQTQNNIEYGESDQNKERENELTLQDLCGSQMKRSVLDRVRTEPFFSNFIGTSDNLPGATRKEQERIQNLFEGVNERNRNVAKEKKQMKQQKDEANSFKAMGQKLSDLKSEYYRFQLYHIINDVRSAREDLEKSEIEIKAGNDALKDLEDEIKLKQAALSKTLREKTKINKQLKKCMKSLDAKKLKGDKMRKQLKSLKKEENKYKNLEDELTESLESNNEKLIELKEQSDLKQEERKKYDEKLEDEAMDIEFEESQYEIYQEVKNRVCQETASLISKKRGFDTIYSRKKDEFDAVQNDLDILRKREDKLTLNVNAMDVEINNLENELDEILEERKKNESELKGKRLKMEQYDKERRELNERLNVVQTELSSLDLLLRESAKEKEQYLVLQTLQKLFSGIYGKLCDLVDCRQSKYALALAVGLGVNHDAIVVEDKQTAIECMEHMRKNRRGHFRFLSLNDIKNKSVPQQFRRFGGTAQPMMDVINFEPQFERAVEFALSSSLVVDTIDEARDIAFGSNRNKNNKIRIISLDGSIIQSNGNISGGFSKDLLDKSKRNKFDEKQRKKKQKERDELISKLRTIDDAMEDQEENSLNVEEIENALNEFENKRKNKMLRMEMYKKQKLEKNAMLKHLKKEMKEKNNKLKKCGKEVEVARDAMDEWDEKVIKAENDIFSEYRKKLGVDTIREYEEQKLEVIEIRTRKKKQFNAELKELENKYNFVEHQNIGNMQEIKKIQSKLKKLNVEIDAIENKKYKKLQKEIEREEIEKKNGEKKSDEMHEETKNKRNMVSDKKKEIDAKRKEITDKMKEKSKMKGWIAKLSQTQINILQQAKHENVALKMKKKKTQKKRRGKHRRKRRKKNDGNSSDEESGESEESEEFEESEQDEMEMSENDDDDIDIIQVMERRINKIDLSEFEREHLEQENEDIEDDEFEYEQKKKQFLVEIEALSSTLNDLQPNMKALEQYKKLQNKWKDGTVEMKEMRKKVTNINDRVDKIRDLRTSALSECFEVIQKNIKKIYGELTKSRQYKHGGKAFLDIGGAINPFDDEIIFNAMPPGKPWREMQQLSGGEKSVASLALLFAIHSFKQSPFFILDEIDAALDAKNVQRVCNFIKKKSQQSQTQIIVISLKDKFFSNADSLIGVCKDSKNGDASKVLSIDLTVFDQEKNHNK